MFKLNGAILYHIRKVYISHYKNYQDMTLNLYYVTFTIHEIT